ncbi:MAG: hypothetical protein AB1750_19620, partial [Chloroflexota bacterium]
APLKNFFQVFLFMSENPTGLQVLFNGETYRAFELPRRYLPTFLALTLTESVWPLFLLGLATAAWKTVTTIRTRWLNKTIAAQELPITNYQLPTTDIVPLWDYWLLITAFVIPFLYVITLQPPMYDGFRHFLFIVPPIFITAGFAFQAIFNALAKFSNKQVKENSRHSLIREIRVKALPSILLLALLAPNLLAIARLHPYEYAYYNSFIGGTGGAFRTYETDYWLTCYKEAVEQINLRAPATLYVHREAYIAARYATTALTVRETRGNLAAIGPDDLVLVNTRTNEDRKTFHDAPIVLEVGRDGATFCVVKQVP